MEKRATSILVIDGDAASRNYLAAMLGKGGYAVFLAPLGSDGLILAWQDQPDIIILDPALPDIPGLDLITRLRQDRRTSEVPCIALSSREDKEEQRALLAAGCNEYLVKSSRAPQQLMELLPHLTNDVSAKRGKLIVFLSAKGGTGTSSLCANIAMSLASSKADEKVAVLDLVLPIGSIAHIVGYQGRLNLTTVAELSPAQTSAAYFAENLPLASGWFFYLLAGAPDPESANRLAGERVNDILRSVLASFDYVFVDLGRSLSRISIPIIQRADVIPLILSTDLATARLTQTIWQYLKSLGVSADNVFVIQNRAVGLEGLTKAELEKMIGLPIRMTMPYMGDNMTVANNRHVPITAWSPHDTFSMLLKQAAEQIIRMKEDNER